MMQRFILSPQFSALSCRLQQIPFLAARGLDTHLFFEQLFANRVTGFFAMDVIVSSFIFRLFVFFERRRLRIKKLMVYVVCNLPIGVSLTVPLFVYFRERKINAKSEV